MIRICILMVLAVCVFLVMKRVSGSETMVSIGATDTTESSVDDSIYGTYEPTSFEHYSTMDENPPPSLAGLEVSKECYNWDIEISAINQDARSSSSHLDFLTQSHCWEEGKEFALDICGDYRNYYSWRTAGHLAIAVGIAAPFANTSLDMDFHNWYQANVRCDTLDDISAGFKVFGEGKYILPFFGSLTLLAIATDEDFGWMDQCFGEYGKNVTRSYLVGAVPMLFMQSFLGGDRPRNGSTNWQPFHEDHAVSGHAYIAATPFIMAAKMSDKIWCKMALYMLSTCTAWSRVNDGAHSLSQVALGWYMAYLACESVCTTNALKNSPHQIQPFFAPGVVGVNYTCRF